MESSLNALILEVDGTCGPRQKSMKCEPRAYWLKTSPARSSISSFFIQSSAYLRRPSSLGSERRDLRAATEIDEMRAEGVLAEDVARALFDQFLFHPVVGVFAQAFVFGGHDALVGQVARLDFPHALLDLFEVFGGEGGGPVEIVIEAGVDGRTDAQLGFGEQLQHGGGEQVRGGMAVDREGGG